MVNVGTLWEFQEPGFLRVLSVIPVSGGGSGSGGSTVAVSGDPAEIASRAAGALFTVEETDDPGAVLLTLPTLLDSEDMDSVSSQLLYVFGPVSEDDLGWLTVTAKGILGMADSSDPGGDPDYIPVVGTVTLTPSITRPLRIISAGSFLQVATVTATFDSDGELSYDGIKTVHVIAPQWSDLSNTAWRWTADIRPGPGQSWSAWSVTFTGTPGTVINLATLMA